ncbi:MAG: hypothetical protein ACRYG7_09295 [Janthinobacterium lividum]
MKSYLLLLALLLLRLFSAQAQDLTNAGRRDSAIKVAVMQHGRYSSFLYTINNEPITPATLKSILKRYPKSAEELRKGSGQKRLAFILLPVAAAGIIIGGIQSDKHLNEGGSAFSRAPVPISIGLGAFFGSAFLAASSNHFGKAIEIYNSQFK